MVDGLFRRMDADDKRMPLRYQGNCEICGDILAKGTDAIYNKTRRAVRCANHATDAASGPREQARPAKAKVKAKKSAETRRRVPLRLIVIGVLALLLAIPQTREILTDTLGKASTTAGKQISDRMISDLDNTPTTTTVPAK